VGQDLERVEHVQYFILPLSSFSRPYERTMGLQDTEDLVTGDEAHLGDTVRVTEGNTDLRGCQTLTGELDDVLNDILRSGLEP
jgi:hypothetical protein